MFTIDDLTPEIRAKISEYKEKCTKDLYSGVEYDNFSENDIIEYIHKIYEYVGFSKPIILIANDPIDYGKKYRILQNNDVANKINSVFEKLNSGENIKEDVKDIYKEFDSKKPDMSISVRSHSLFLCSSYHRVYLTWYKFIQDEFKIKHKNEEILNWFYKRANNNILRSYFTNHYVLVLRMPKYIRRNDIGFHSVDKPSIEWLNYKMYYINGRKIDEKYFNAVSNKTITFNDFMKIDDEDTKANIISMINEKYGEEYLMEFLDAKVVDEQTVSHSSGHIETVKLWKTNQKFEFLNDLNGNMNQPYAWIELICPTSGSKYLISTSPHFVDALEACKFHRPSKINLDMEYDFEEFNN